MLKVLQQKVACSYQLAPLVAETTLQSTLNATIQPFLQSTFSIVFPCWALLQNKSIGIVKDNMFMQSGKKKKKILNTKYDLTLQINTKLLKTLHENRSYGKPPGEAVATCFILF